MTLGCNRNRSKYQPKGHFDAAVGGRRRQQKAAAGSALEKLRQRRLQQAALTGAPHALNRLNRLHVVLTHSALYTPDLASYPASSCCSLHVRGDPFSDSDSCFTLVLSCTNRLLSQLAGDVRHAIFEPSSCIGHIIFLACHRGRSCGQ